MDIALLATLVFMTWAVHGAVSSFYRKKFASTKSLQFRLTHTGEIFMLTFLMMLIYKALTSFALDIIPTASIVLGVLIVLDGLLLYFSKSSRNIFDGLHFIAAYTAVIMAVALALAI